MHPQPRVRFVVGVCTRVFTAEAPETSGIPHAMVLRLIRALPGDRALLPPSSLRSLLLKNLTPASGRQDHTPSPSASSAFVSHAICVHRIPLPTSVTIAIRPSCGGGTAARKHNFRFSERKMFRHAGLTTQISLNPLAKLDFTRRRFSPPESRSREATSSKIRLSRPVGQITWHL